MHQKICRKNICGSRKNHKSAKILSLECFVSYGMLSKILWQVKKVQSPEEIRYHSDRTSPLLDIFCLTLAGIALDSFTTTVLKSKNVLLSNESLLTRLNTV